MIAWLSGCILGLLTASTRRAWAPPFAIVLSVIPAFVPVFHVQTNPQDARQLSAWLLVGLSSGMALAVPRITRWAARAWPVPAIVGALLAVEGAALLGMLHGQFAPGDPGHPGLLALVAGLSCGLSASASGTLRSVDARVWRARLGGVFAAILGVALGWWSAVQPAGGEVAANAAAVAAIGLLPVALSALPGLLLGQPRRAAPALALLWILGAPIFAVGAVADTSEECGRHGPGAPEWCAADATPRVCEHPPRLREDAGAGSEAEPGVPTTRTPVGNVSTYELMQDWGMSPYGVKACYREYPYPQSPKFFAKLSFTPEGAVSEVQLPLSDALDEEDRALGECLSRVFAKTTVPGVRCTGTTAMQVVTTR